MTPALTDAQRQQLREQLDRREADLHEQVRAVNADEAEAPSRTPHSQVEDIGEQGEQRTRDAIRYAEKERDLTELRQIDDARRRMDLGDYGICIDCGDDIPLARLQAQPFSERCLPCQEAWERAHPTDLRIGTALP